METIGSLLSFLARIDQLALIVAPYLGFFTVMAVVFRVGRWTEKYFVQSTNPSLSGYLKGASAFFAVTCVYHFIAFAHTYYHTPASLLLPVYFFGFVLSIPDALMCLLIKDVNLDWHEQRNNPQNNVTAH